MRFYAYGGSIRTELSTGEGRGENIVGAEFFVGVDSARSRHGLVMTGVDGFPRDRTVCLLAISLSIVI